MSNSIETYQYLKFVTRALGLVNMWPTQKRLSFLRQYYIIIIIILTTFPILADFIAQFYEDLSLTTLNENLVALSALYAVIYISICFMQRKDQIKELVNYLTVFEQFSPESLIRETENSINFYTKFFIFYGIIGNICYGLMPFLAYKDCKRNRSEHMTYYGIPCGLVVRFLLPFRIDYTPISQLVMAEEIIVCTLGTTITLMVTMLICGVLKHITAHLKHLKNLITELSEYDGDLLEEKLRFCVIFHVTIINYSTKADENFSRMMLLHITWTSFIISVLGFEIIMVTNYVETLRFFLHLAGWMGMLFIVCYYGQTLLDESSKVANSVYSIRWYEKPCKVRKILMLMLLRSQRPLVLKAGGIKILSLSAFLAVLYTAYSYFTLLLKLKP